MATRAWPTRSGGKRRTGRSRRKGAAAAGVGLCEAPRGALAHFAVIENNRMKNYQMVVPTTWNASPRDENGNLSPYESALIGTPIHDANQPLEILRTIHSFDPCLACAVHLYDEEGKYVHQMDTF